MDIHRPRCPRLPGTQIFQIKAVTSRLKISPSSDQTWARNDRYHVNKCRPKVGHSSGDTWAGEDRYKVSKWSRLGLR